MVVIRLSRCGSKRQPRYRINVADSKRAVLGKFIETLGFYNPFSKGENSFRLNKESYDQWVKKGAQPSRRVQSLVKKLS